MHEPLLEIFGFSLTGWKVVGYLGALLFSARWVVQVWASRNARRPVVPVIFWLFSMAGSLMCLSYFVIGKPDSVGMLTNLFPSSIAGYNLYLAITHKRSRVNLNGDASSQ